MKRKLKELIDNAEYRKGGTYEWFLLVPTNKKYKGFWGETGYNNIIVIGYVKSTGKFYRLDQNDSDLLEINDITRGVRFDVPEEYGCIRVWDFSTVYEIESQLSSISANARRERKDVRKSDRDI